MGDNLFGILTGKVVGTQHWSETRTTAGSRNTYVDGGGFTRTYYVPASSSTVERGRYFLEYESGKEAEFPLGKWFAVRKGHHVSVALSRECKHEGELLGCINHTTGKLWTSDAFRKRHHPVMKNGKWVGLVMGFLVLFGFAISIVFPTWVEAQGGDATIPILAFAALLFIPLFFIARAQKRARRKFDEDAPDVIDILRVSLEEAEG